MMTKAEFFKQLNQHANVLQSAAQNMTLDQEQAHQLYLETIHQGLKNPRGIKKHHGFAAWLLTRMKSIFWNDLKNLA